MNGIPSDINRKLIGMSNFVVTTRPNMKPSAPEKSTVAASRNWEPSHLMEQKSEIYVKCMQMYPGVRIAIPTLDKVEKRGAPIVHPGLKGLPDLSATVRPYDLSSRKLIIYRGRVSVRDDELEKERKSSLEEIVQRLCSQVPKEESRLHEMFGGISGHADIVGLPLPRG
ncbi:uncharacterized protein BDW43DRAFT_48861 [Aspergillus alliaceus]|uniref:uncharacterized protein n=1 Tax=Petromyces alliaceus TaxID=209559 RepID=UPI0012A4CA61|nr:uncharacterized protein BDW43DRAFT_48861 [Aspergillus alliaceus]KAB8235006.1 hypothetical protein BDW43DRAFT_48861 [Aspergillus alliaceus]